VPRIAWKHLGKGLYHFHRTQASGAWRILLLRIGPTCRTYGQYFSRLFTLKAKIVQGDLFTVASELTNIFLYPLQGNTLWIRVILFSFRLHYKISILSLTIDKSGIPDTLLKHFFTGKESPSCDKKQSFKNLTSISISRWLYLRLYFPKSIKIKFRCNKLRSVKKHTDNSWPHIWQVDQVP